MNIILKKIELMIVFMFNISGKRQAPTSKHWCNFDTIFSLSHIIVFYIMLCPFLLIWLTQSIVKKIKTKTSIRYAKENDREKRGRRREIERKVEGEREKER